MPAKQHYLTGIDLGSSRTRCVVAIEEDSRLRFISHGSAETASGAWKRGLISDQDPVVESIERAVDEAERNGGMLVESAVVGVGGPHVRSNVSHAYINLGPDDEEIEKRHVDAAVKAAAQGPLSEDRTVLQAVPFEFSVDHQPGTRNPLGMRGGRLDAHVQVISDLAQPHNNVRAAVNRAGVVVEETISEGFAAGYAALEEQEREVGVALADMGAGSVELIVYHENDLRLATSVPIGGDHFASDVAAVLRTPRDAAARLIEQYGCALAEQTPDNVVVEAPGLVDGELRTHSRRLLNEIIQARAEELFELIDEEFHRARLRGRVVGGLVLTGGLSCLVGACDLAERTLGVDARIGLPPRLEDLPDELDHPGWATCIGLVLYAQRLRLHRKRRRDRVTEWLRALLD